MMIRAIRDATMSSRRKSAIRDDARNWLFCGDTEAFSALWVVDCLGLRCDFLARLYQLVYKMTEHDPSLKVRLDHTLRFALGENLKRRKVVEIKAGVGRGKYTRTAEMRRKLAQRMRGFSMFRPRSLERRAQ